MFVVGFCFLIVPGRIDASTLHWSWLVVACQLAHQGLQRRVDDRRVHVDRNAPSSSGPTIRSRRGSAPPVRSLQPLGRARLSSHVILSGEARSRYAAGAGRGR
jgi:hypothetical protein